MTLIADMLNRVGGTWVKFENPGDRIEGTILSADTRQRTKFGTHDPAFFDNGDPQMEIVITLQTEERDPANPQDDGTRKVVVKTWGAQMYELKRAVSTAGDTDLQRNGRFSMTYTGLGEPSKPGIAAPKMYAMTYEKPSQTAGLLAGQQGQQAAAPTQQQSAPQQAQQQPVQQQAQQGASAPNSAVHQARKLIALGLSDADIASTTGLDANVVAALRG